MSGNSHPSKYGIGDDDSKLPKPKRLKTLAFSVVDSEKNNQLHQFVLNHSDPIDSGYINAVLRSMPRVSVNALNQVGRSALHLAVLKNDLLMVKKLLSCLPSIDINMSDNSCEDTALHLAIKLGNVDIVQELVNKGAGLEIENGIGFTPLCMATQLGNLDIMDRLLKKGANVGPVNLVKGPLYYAARSGNLKAVTLLASKGAPINAGNIWCLLHCAAYSGNLGIVEFLLHSDINVDRKSERWSKLLFPATRSGNREIMRLIMDQGVDVYATDEYGRTLLHYVIEVLYAADHAAQYEGLETVEFLVANGFDVNSRDEWGETPLHYSVRFSHFKTMEFLVGKGADVNAKDKKGTTPLHLAIQYAHLETAEILVGKGADVQARNKFGETPLHLSVHCENLEITEYLVDKGADVNAKDEKGITPLHRAVCHARLETVKCLVSNGADVNTRNNEDITPLHRAVCYKGLETVEFLVGEGADVNARDKDGITPLHLGTFRAHLDTVEFLVGKGADVNARDENGLTPFYFVYFREADKIKCARFLLDRGADVHIIHKDGKALSYYALNLRYTEFADLLIKKSGTLNIDYRMDKRLLRNAVIRESMELTELLLESSGFNIKEEYPDMRVIFESNYIPRT